MAFVVEDGTSRADATSYLAVADADSYHTDRGNSAWTGSDTVKQQALIKATDHIERVYGHRFRGVRADEDQALSWPRDAVVLRDGTEIDDDVIPAALKNAVAEYALRALTAALTPDPGTTLGQIEQQSKRVGPIETTTKYRFDAASLPSYPEADLYLRPLITAGLRAVRA